MEDSVKRLQHLWARILNYQTVQIWQTIVLPACLGAFSLGTVLAWTSPALPHIADCLQDCDYFYTAIEGSWIGSLATLGCLAGCFATGFLMDIVGRKWTITGMAIPLLIGWILMLLPQLVGIDPSITIWIFYVGRFILGKFHSASRETCNKSSLQAFLVVHTLLCQAYTLLSAQSQMLEGHLGI